MRYIELAKKIKALADNGQGGEKVNAEKMLNDLLKKHQLSIEDIEGEKSFDYFFVLKKEEEQLWMQIVKRVNYEIKIYGKFPAKKVRDLGLKGNYMITCTASEYIEIESMFVFYQRLYKKELEVFYVAFCKANDLLVNGPKSKSVDDLTDQEYEEWLRVNSMSTKIKRGTFRKQLNP